MCSSQKNASLAFLLSLLTDIPAFLFELLRLEPARDIVLCSWTRHFTQTMPLSTQVYKWVPAKLTLGATPRWTTISFKEVSWGAGGLHVKESALMDHLVRMQTLTYAIFTDIFFNTYEYIIIWQVHNTV